ncbi:MAG: hypothetical protein RIR18_2357 [Pseudomonadota bacterium]|jgi:hypothetical protein
MNSESSTPSLEQLLEEALMNQHGPMITGKSLWEALGFTSGDAFRQAIVRKTLPIPVFSIENRRGKFALTKDVAIWLARTRSRNT